MSKHEEVSQPVRFAIGEKVKFGNDSWVITKYHRIGTWWEVMFKSLATGVHRSVACKQLELYTE